MNMYDCSGHEDGATECLHNKEYGMVFSFVES